MQEGASSNDPDAADPIPGVGPWPGGPDAWAAALAADDRLDLELLEHGDTRTEEIRHLLQARVPAIIRLLTRH